MGIGQEDLLIWGMYSIFFLIFINEQIRLLILRMILWPALELSEKIKKKNVTWPLLDLPASIQVENGLLSSDWSPLVSAAPAPA